MINIVLHKKTDKVLETCFINVPETYIYFIAQKIWSTNKYKKIIIYDYKKICKVFDDDGTTICPESYN